MSRLDFVPGRKEQRVNLEEGTLRFTPVSGRRIDLRHLVKRIEDAGYKVPSVEITMTGKLIKRKELSAVEDSKTGQIFALDDSEITRNMFKELGPGATVRIKGSFLYHIDTPESIAVKQYTKP